MTIRKIARIGEPILRQRAEQVPESRLGSAALRDLVVDLIDTMRDANGAGIAAPQIFEPWQVCVLEVAENRRYPEFPRIPLTVLVNPVLTPIIARVENAATAPSDFVAVYEGCLSVPGLRGRVVRPRKVRLDAVNPEGELLTSTWEGVAAAVIQHEIDHLNGKLFVDRADPTTLTGLDEFERYIPMAERFVDRTPLWPASEC